MYFDVTRHVCNVSCCEGDQFQLWHTHERECIHRCDVRLTSTEPVLCRQILHECPSSLSQSRCRDPSHLGRCGSFCSSSYSPFFVFFFFFQIRATVLQSRGALAGWSPSTLSFSTAVWVCAGCRSPSGSECSAGCWWGSAEGGRGSSLDKKKKRKKKKSFLGHSVFFLLKCLQDHKSGVWNLTLHNIFTVVPHQVCWFLYIYMRILKPACRKQVGTRATKDWER